MDSLAPASALAKNGLYRVGTDLFNHKINALTAATLSKKPVIWEFGNQTWNNLDWKKDDGLPLMYWYKERARQLREKYDYLILAFSGGADSHNIASVFLKENIKIDEVWCDQPLEHTQDYNFNKLDLSAGNMPSEWEFAIKPQLAQLSALTDWKITITDSTKSMDDEDSEDSLLVTQYSYYATIKRWRMLDRIIEQASKTHQRVGVMVGIEKPNFVLVNGVLCSYFSDGFMQIKTEYTERVKRDIEYFYWAPELPELHRSQCHSFLKFLQANPSKISQCVHGKISRDLSIQLPENQTLTEANQTFRLLLNDSIYPFWQTGTFQVHKPLNKLYHNEFYDWMKVKFKNHRALESNRSSLDNRLRSLAPEFLLYGVDGKTILNYKFFQTKYYPIALIKDLTQ